MKFKFIGLVFFMLFSSSAKTQELDQLIDNWHLAASEANFNNYFGKMSENSVFIGTAPNERWTKSQFITFAKPFFDKGKAWDFKAKNRKWSYSEDRKTAWFDEELSTWMQDCRGSGVVQLINEEWKIVFYDLHVLIENEKIKEFIELRKK